MFYGEIMREPANSKNCVVLIVDDQVELCDILAEDLDYRGYTTLTAHSGNKAFEIYKEKHIDILLSDIKMPDGDGLELVRYICNFAKRTPVLILMTGYADVRDQDILDMGVEKIYYKPVDMDELIDDIDVFKEKFMP